jgi:uncharacterized protein (DUF1501 family)
MTRTRREFIRRCVAFGATGAAMQFNRIGGLTGYAQPASDYKALVCIFLFGGNDSNNLIIPNDSRYNLYSTMRGPVALGASTLLPAGNTGYAFHPSLTNVRRLFDQGVAAPVLNVGTLVQPTTKATLNSVPLPRSLQSHSDQTQQWQSSDPNGGETGWGGRIIDKVGALNTGSLTPGITVNNGSALFLNGQHTAALNVSSGTTTSGLRSFGSSSAMTGRSQSLQRLLTFDTGLQLVSAADGVLADSMQSVQEMNAALAGAPTVPVTFPTSGLGQQLSQVTRLISVRNTLGMRRQIFFAGIGGFDHHENLVTGQAGLLTTIDQAVSAFFAALESMGLANQVTLFTESEFNRTGNANATLGTDHAWGGHHLVFGGAVRGGTSYGTLPTLQLRGPDDMGSRGTWIPTTSLDQYGATLGSWFGVADQDLDAVFPNLGNFPQRGLGFLSTGPVPPTFTNDPLAAQSTMVRAVHLTELRSAIATLRAGRGLSAMAWTDPLLVPGVTMVKGVHLMELRSAVSDVYAAASRTPPVFSSMTGFIRAQHVDELRAAVLAIWPLV